MNNPNCGKCGMLNHAGYCSVTACIYLCPTGMGGYINKPTTNADRIRAMSDEELAHFLDNTDGCFPPNVETCSIEESEQYWLEWLKKEAE